MCWGEFRFHIYLQKKTDTYEFWYRLNAAVDHNSFVVFNLLCSGKKNNTADTQNYKAGATPVILNLESYNYDFKYLNLISRLTVKCSQCPAHSVGRQKEEKGSHIPQAAYNNFILNRLLGKGHRTFL